MSRVAVVIPFFQREAGILRRALASVLAQELPPQTQLCVYVCDDGSPVSAQSEAQSLAFAEPFSIKIITQPNSGVVAARNNALSAVGDAADYIAFLDSDDVWLPGHLAQALAALETGADLYFCDNAREGFHDSQLAGDDTLQALIRQHPGQSLVRIGKEAMTTATLRHFPCQISTTVFRRAKAPGLLFDMRIKNAGEDVLFFLQLLEKIDVVCFSPDIKVQCGSGVNLYFGNFDWEAPGFLSRIIDNMKAHSLIGQAVSLSPENKAWNEAYMRNHRHNITYHTLRRWLKNKGVFPPEVLALKRQDASFCCWFMRGIAYVLAGRIMGFYKP